MKTRKKLKLPLWVRQADLAMKLAVKGVMKEHKLRGLPIYVMENNRIVKIPPHKI